MIGLRETAGGLILTVQVQPRASRAEIIGCRQDALKIKLTAPPAEGAANKQCIALLAKALGRPKSTLSIVAGRTSRIKQILIGPKQGALSASETEAIKRKLQDLARAGG